MKAYSLGIDIGYSAVKAAITDNEKKVVFAQYQPHRGKIKKTLEAILNQINNDFSPNYITHGAITGTIGKKLSKNKKIQGVNDVAAAIEGVKFLVPEARSVIEIGGQNARYYTGFNIQNQDNSEAPQKNMLQISTNSDCAAGTGSFLEEQASRLNIRIEDYADYVEKAQSIPRIAGRCSVFAKTDIIHNQQEGVPPEDILKGVAYAIVKNYKGAVIRRLPVEVPLVFIGGVSNNRAIIDTMRDVLNKNEQELLVPEHSDIVSAIGAALIAKKENLTLDFQKMSKDLLSEQNDIKDAEEEELPPLSRIKNEDISEKHLIQCSMPERDNPAFFLGIDIGSTSTNLVLINSGSEIVTYKYIRTKGNPLKAVQNGMEEIDRERKGNFSIAGVGITGSGRNLIGQQIGADIIRDEITAQAKAAIKINPEVDTIFEIGGQDSKFISITNGAVTDFQMNKVCAAGTGSFLDEQAQEFNIPVEELEQLAFQGKHPASLGERCTVFIKSAIVSGLSGGEKKEDIVAGLCYSIAKNYLHRVAGQKKIGNKIMLQGGIAFNRGVANAFRILTGKQINTTPFFSVTGAYGAALITREEMKGKETTFIGIENLRHISQYGKKQIRKNNNDNTGEFNKRIEKTIFEDYDRVLDPDKKTVGIPRALFTYGMFPMFDAIFKNLGFNVLLSDWSNENTIKLGQEYAMEETCFPVKLILGHVAELVSKKVDYIFFPDLYTVDHPGSKSRKDFGCAYMQLAFKIVNHTMELEKKGIKLVAPTFAFSMGGKFMQQSFSNLGGLLGKSKEETGRALQKGMEAALRFEERMGKNGQKTNEKLDPNKLTFVIISKMYGIADPVLNLGVPDKLQDMGYQVLPFFDLPEGIDIASEHPNMFWPFGQHILEPAYLIREHPNMYPVLLTHHGCGPDSVLLHYFKEIMGNKPYLNIEVDEHASKIGVTTRLEAFVNSLKVNKDAALKDLNYYIKKINYKKPNIKSSPDAVNPGTKMYIPNLYPYSGLFKELLQQKGFKAEILETNAKAINTGRQHTLTNEYYSLASLLGSCFNALEQDKEEKNVAFLIPQTEGAEVEGQYNRILRTKFDACKYKDVEIIAPFLEDVISLNESSLKSIFYCIIAGDIINAAPYGDRVKYLLQFRKLIRDKKLDISALKTIAGTIYDVLKNHHYKKQVMAIGEPVIVFNDFLNDFTFRTLEEQDNKVVYGVLSEAVWVFWKDYVTQNSQLNQDALNKKLAGLKEDIEQVSYRLKEEGPFTPGIGNLVEKADTTIGYYAGAFARYRQAKVLCNPANIDGIITAASLYENTGVSLSILHKGFSGPDTKPILNLTFDGNRNENDRDKVESFIYYL